MRLILIAVGVASVVVTLPQIGLAQSPKPEDLAALLQTLRPVGRTTRAVSPPALNGEGPRVSTTRGGYLRSIGAPPGKHFVLSGGNSLDQPDITARNFLSEQGRLFGVTNPAVDFTTLRSRKGGNRTSVRLRQRFQGIPVIAGEVIVQVNSQGAVEALMADLDTGELGTGPLALTPSITAQAATEAARMSFAAQTGGTPVQSTTPVLSLFVPAILDETGSPQLVWDFDVFTADRQWLNERVLADAHTGKVIRVWTRRHDFINRQISDKTNNPTGPAGLVRSEGQLPIGLTEVDNAYTYLGSTYTFYFAKHNRDSYDGAGATLNLITRYCDLSNPCPWANATAGPPMRFGAGFVTEDIVAHEFTHLVTAAESDLIYTNASGAINESLSDIWGELIDQTYSGGNDAPNVKWLYGEDRATGASRSMNFPTNYLHPDRLFSPYYVNPINTADNGAVHTNSGVNNKLCYLLTDGDTFNGQKVEGFGIDDVVDLYYEAQVNLLTSGAGWTELFDALQQAAVNLGWSVSDRNNLYRACVAVEIAGAGRILYVDQNANCTFPAGLPNCQLSLGPFETMAQAVNGARPGDTLRIRPGAYSTPATIDKILTLTAESDPVILAP